MQATWGQFERLQRPQLMRETVREHASWCQHANPLWCNLGMELGGSYLWKKQVWQGRVAGLKSYRITVSGSWEHGQEASRMLLGHTRYGEPGVRRTLGVAIGALIVSAWRWIASRQRVKPGNPV